MTTNTAELKLLKRAAKQLTEWHKQYGANNPQWLPPAGDVRLLEDIDEALAGRSAAHGEQSKVRQCNHEWVHREAGEPWLVCEKCGVRYEDRDKAACDSGKCGVGGYCDDCKAGSAEQVSEREACGIDRSVIKRLAVQTGFTLKQEAPDGPDLKLYVYDFAFAIARAALSAPERNTATSMKPDADLMEKASAIVKRLYNDTPDYGMCVQAGEIIQWFMRYAVHAAPERKVMTDKEVWKLYLETIDGLDFQEMGAKVT
jgi:hypothetical protein